MTGKMQELHDIAIRSILDHADNLVFADLDQDEAVEAALEDFFRRFQLPSLIAEGSEETLEPSVLGKIGKVAAKLADRLPLFSSRRENSDAEKIEAIAKTIAAGTEVLAAHKVPMLSFSLVLKPKVSNYKREEKKQRRRFRNCEIDLYSLTRCHEYAEMMKDKTILGSELADDVYVKTNAKWEDLTWEYRPTNPVSDAMYNVAVFKKDRSDIEQFLDDLRDKLEEMGYITEYTPGKFGSSYDFFYKIVWMDRNEWEKILIVAFDPSAIEAWKAGVPIDDIVV